MTAYEAAPGSAVVAHTRNGTNGTTATTKANVAKTTSDFVPPPKGYFSPSPTKTIVGINNGHPAGPYGVTIDRQASYTTSNAQSHGVFNADALAGSEASSVPKGRSRPRRESIGQMIRKASDSATAAASAGGIGISFANRGQPIPAGRGGAYSASSSRPFSTSPRVGPDGVTPASFPASLGSAAEALSLPPSVLNSGAKAGRPTGHTHFGQECYGPEPGEAIPPNPPSNAEVGKGAVPSSAPVHGSAGTAALLAAANAAATDNDAEGRTRRDSVTESMIGEDESLGNSSSRSAGGKESALHRCESCLKVYRHPSCLIKHRWEHTVYWKEASKFLMSKHQQVQLLEAAAILVNMDGDAQSLPDEKALWPAAVSPAASGLLGSDRVNFDKLMQRKAALRGRTPSISSNACSNPREMSFEPDGASVASPLLSRSAGGGLSPLNSFTKLGLNGTPTARAVNGNGNAFSFGNGNGSYTSAAAGPYSFGSHRLNSDIAHLALDESDEVGSGAILSKNVVGGTSGSFNKKTRSTTTTTSGTSRTSASATSRTTGEDEEEEEEEEEISSSMEGSSPASSRSPAEDEEEEEDEDDEEREGEDGSRGVGMTKGKKRRGTGNVLGGVGVGPGGVGVGVGAPEKKWGLHEDALAEMDMDE